MYLHFKTVNDTPRVFGVQILTDKKLPSDSVMMGSVIPHPSFFALCFSGDKKFSILHLSCRTSDLQFSLILQTLYSVCNKDHKLDIYNRTSLSNSSQRTTAWEEFSGSITRPF